MAASQMQFTLSIHVRPWLVYAVAAYNAIPWALGSDKTRIPGLLMRLGTRYELEEIVSNG